MRQANIYEGMGGWTRLMFLVLFFIGGFFLAIILLTIISIVLGESGAGTTPSVTFLKMAQLVQAPSIFLFPAFMYAFVFYGDTGSYFKLKVMPNYKLILASFAIIIIAQPMLQLTSYYNEIIPFPESMSHIEQWMLSKEDAARKIIELFISDKSLTSVLSNIFLIVVLAAIVEEIFFRGCLQQIMMKITKNKHLAIWITAFIFSAIHFQFYGFIPRLLAGALLGYMFIWTANLWVPILVHMVHNAINISVAQYYYGTEKYGQLENMGIENHQWLGIVSFLSLSLLIFVLKKKNVFLTYTN